MNNPPRSARSALFLSMGSQAAPYPRAPRFSLRALLLFASLATAFAAQGCLSDYTGDCTRNPEKDCFWGGAGAAGGTGGGTTTLPPACGDDHLDPGEACDDGNTTNCDGCRGDCSAKETGCGDAFVCAPEACDNGSANSDTGACTTKCQEPACGDGTVQADEECDDGNEVAGDGCSKTCKDECTKGTFQTAALFYDKEVLHCYLRVEGSKKSWVGAQNSCKLWNAKADLVAFSSSAEIIRVQTSLPATAGVNAWTGGNDKDVAGQYLWSNGEPFPADASIWATAQPDDDANTQQCLSLDAGYLIFDEDCGVLEGFLCELDLAALK